MLRLLKYKYPLVCRVKSTFPDFSKSNSFFSFNKRDFFKKTNFLQAKDYYSK